VVYYTRWWYWALTGLLLFLLVSSSHAEVSVNLPLDDPAYLLLDKLVTSNFTTIHFFSSKW
jgi:hypothetical protein